MLSHTEGETAGIASLSQARTVNGHGEVLGLGEGARCLAGQNPRIGGDKRIADIVATGHGELQGSGGCTEIQFLGRDCDGDALHGHLYNDVGPTAIGGGEADGSRVASTAHARAVHIEGDSLPVACGHFTCRGHTGEPRGIFAGRPMEGSIATVDDIEGVGGDFIAEIDRQLRNLQLCGRGGQLEVTGGGLPGKDRNRLGIGPIILFHTLHGIVAI